MNNPSILLTFIGRIFLFALLTVFTQTGGLIYLLFLATDNFIKLTQCGLRWLAKTGWFILLYIFINFLIIPPLARMGGRVPLPVAGNTYLKPATLFTCLLNRHYVCPQLKQAVNDIANAMHTRYPGTVIHYLDAGFPFFNGFPLFPHLSHNDGQKLDLALLYTNTTGIPVNNVPSIIGYGISEGPRPGEVNTPGVCACKGYWQYSLLNKLVPQFPHSNYLFDSIRTRQLAICCATNPDIGKLFIEPHLKTRLHLTNTKIRFHGCQAVRHDDHIHIQL